MNDDLNEFHDIEEQKPGKPLGASPLSRARDFHGAKGMSKTTMAGFAGLLALLGVGGYIYMTLPPSPDDQPATPVNMAPAPQQADVNPVDMLPPMPEDPAPQDAMLEGGMDPMMDTQAASMDPAMGAVDGLPPMPEPVPNDGMPMADGMTAMDPMTADTGFSDPAMPADMTVSETVVTEDPMAAIAGEAALDPAAIPAGEGAAAPVVQTASADALAAGDATMPVMPAVDTGALPPLPQDPAVAGMDASLSAPAPALPSTPQMNVPAAEDMASATPVTPVVPADNVQPPSDVPSPANDTATIAAATTQAATPPAAPSAGAMGGAPTAAATGVNTVDVMRELADQAEAAYIRPLPKGFLVMDVAPATSRNSGSQMLAAQRHLKDGKPSEALRAYDDLYAQHPNDETVMMGRALALQQAGRDSDALVVYEQLLNLNARNLDALTNMLGILSKQDPAMAASKLESLRMTYPSDSKIAAQLGVAYGALRNYGAAQQALESAQRMDPQNAFYVYNLAIIYDRQGKREQAARAYRSALDLAEKGKTSQPIPKDAIYKRLAVL